LAITVAAALLIRRSTWGFELRMRGLNPNLSYSMGVDPRRQIPQIMTLSGAIVGLGGAIATVATFGRYIDGSLTIPGVGLHGRVAAVIGNGDPAGAMVAALFLAALQTGAGTVSLETNVPTSIYG